MRPAFVKATAMLVMAVLIPAMATADTGSEAADCAALWQGAADVQRKNPGLAVAPGTSEALVTSFSGMARSHGVSDAALGAILREKVSGYRLMYRAVIGGDKQSTDLLDRRAQSCDRLLKAGG
ncbi:hypothetical protein [Salipiger sp.]|uniref:hypothetical protein n=1 Tax=Salipiger sp. TaxID=2078585 RepID=UPI003A96B1DA